MRPDAAIRVSVLSQKGQFILERLQTHQAMASESSRRREQNVLNERGLSTENIFLLTIYTCENKWFRPISLRDIDYRLKIYSNWPLTYVRINFSSDVSTQFLNIIFYAIIPFL